VELAVSLFGPAIEVKAMGQTLPNGVNYADIVLLKHHSGVLTNIMCSKAANGMIGSEILSDEGTLYFENLLRLNNMKLFDIAENKEYLLFTDDATDMFYYEIDVFVKMIMEEDYMLNDYLLKITAETVKIL